MHRRCDLDRQRAWRNWASKRSHGGSGVRSRGCDGENADIGRVRRTNANIRHLPVVSGDRLLSMLSIRDLMRVDLEDKGQEIRTLQEYLYQVPPGTTR